MEWITDDILFYGGIIVSFCSALTLVISLLLFHIGKLKLNAKLIDEYGNNDRKKVK